MTAQNAFALNIYSFDTRRIAHVPREVGVARLCTHSPTHPVSRTHLSHSAHSRHSIFFSCPISDTNDI